MDDGSLGDLTFADVFASSGMDMSTIDSGGLTTTLTDPTTAPIDSSPSFFESLWNDAKSALPAIMAAIPTASNTLIGKALDAAKTSVLSTTASNLASRPDVKAAGLTTLGNTIGGFFLNYWKEIALVGLLVLWYLVRAKR